MGGPRPSWEGRINPPTARALMPAPENQGLRLAIEINGTVVKGWLSYHQMQKRRPSRTGVKISAPTKAQWASAHTRFLVKYIRPANTIRKIIARRPIFLRSTSVGSAAQDRNAAMSLA